MSSQPNSTPVRHYIPKGDLSRDTVAAAVGRAIIYWFEGFGEDEDFSGSDFVDHAGQALEEHGYFITKQDIKEAGDGY